MSRLCPSQIQQLVSYYVHADRELPITREFSIAVSSMATTGGGTLLLPAVDLDDSGPYHIVEPRAITALDTYLEPLYGVACLLLTPPLLDQQTNQLRRIADIISTRAEARAGVGRPAVG